MTYGQIKTQTLRLLDEFSTTGLVSTTQDVLGRIQGFANDALFDLTIKAAKIPALYTIIHNPLYNELSRDTSTIEKHLPDVDFSVELTGARACFFECSGPATVTIDEKINDVWTNIETITITSSTLTEYKRLIAPSSLLNSVRLRFTGAYAYDYVNYIIYPYPFPTYADVQQHRPFFLYSLPSDFLKLNYIEVKKDARQYINYIDYKRTPDNKLALSRYDIGEYLIHYWRKPIELVFTGNQSTDDAQIIDTDMPTEGVQLVPYFIAAHSLIAEGDMTKGITLLNMYEAKVASLPGPDVAYSSTIINVTGW